jgi:DNA-binding NtrC family response regulator
LRDPDMVVREFRSRLAAQRVCEPMQVVVGDSSANGATKKTILEQVNKAKNEAETTAILAALESTQWNRKQAAALLKIDYKALLYKMKKLGIDDKMATFSAVERSEPAAAAAAGD